MYACIIHLHVLQTTLVSIGLCKLSHILLSPYSYVHEAADGIEPETEFVYDLQVPVDFIPVPLDKEVSEYYLWDMEKVSF